MNKIVVFMSLICVCSCVLGQEQNSSTTTTNTSTTTITNSEKKDQPVKDFDRPRQTVCVVTGVKVDLNDKTIYTDYQGVRYYFLNMAAKEKFTKSAWTYYRDILTCEVCSVQENKKARTFLECKFEAKTFYACCLDHKKYFDKEPAKYIKKSMYIPAPKRGKSTNHINSRW